MKESWMSEVAWFLFKKLLEVMSYIIFAIFIIVVVALTLIVIWGFIIIVKWLIINGLKGIIDIMWCGLKGC